MIYTEGEIKEFKEFEKEGWEDAANTYHKLWGKLTRNAALQMLNLLHVKKGSSLLDLATGAGYVAVEANRRGAEVTGIDISLNQIELAKSITPGINYVLGDMERLSFKNDSFDFVTINLGLLHSLQPEEIISECYRVLKPGGKLIFTVWSKPDKSIGMKILLDAIESYGSSDVKLPKSQPYYRFSDKKEVQNILQKAGFKFDKFKEIKLWWEFNGTNASDKLFQSFQEGAVRTTALLRQQSEVSLKKVRKYMQEQVVKFENSSKSQVKIPMSVSLTIGIKEM